MNNYALETFANPQIESSIAEYQNMFDLSIGVYIQEFAIDRAAASTLIDHINLHPDVYKLGFGKSLFTHNHLIKCFIQVFSYFQNKI